jgi:hypothetical protein
VALLSPGQSLHVGRGIPVDGISESLQDALYDCDWLPYEVVENDTQVAGSELVLRNENYRVLIVPAVEAIPYGVLERFESNHSLPLRCSSSCGLDPVSK